MKRAHESSTWIEYIEQKEGYHFCNDSGMQQIVMTTVRKYSLITVLWDLFQSVEPSLVIND
jgi:hypothetical protein